MQEAKYGKTACSAQEMLFRAAERANAQGQKFLVDLTADTKASGVQDVASEPATVEPDGDGKQEVAANAKAAATDYAYTAATGVVTFTSAPASGTENIVVSYGVAPSFGAVIAAAYAVSGTATGPARVLADDADASGDSAVTAVACRSGNFNRAALIVASGYSLTATDEETPPDLGAEEPVS